MLGWVFQFGTGEGEGASWVDVWEPTAGRGNHLSDRWKQQKRLRSWRFLGVFEEGQGCHGAKGLSRHHGDVGMRTMQAIQEIWL